MSSGKKALLALSCVMFTLMMTIALVLQFYGKQNPSAVVYPESGLTDSIFDSQNTDYVKNESLTVTNPFDMIPYTYDAPNVDAAVVDNGKVYKLSDELYLYATCLPKSAALETVVAHELGTALLMDLDESQSIIRIMTDDNGFINGYDARYVIDNLVVRNEKQRVECNLLGYRLVVPNQSDDVFLSVVHNGKESSSTYSAMKSVMASFLYTFQYSSSLDSEQRSRADAEAKAIAKEKADREQKETAQRQEEEERKAEKDEKTKYLAAGLTQSYDDLQLTIYWSVDSATPTVTLYNPDRTISYSPTSSGGGKAVFRIGPAQKGTWIVEMFGTGYGDCSMEQQEMASSVNGGAVDVDDEPVASEETDAAADGINKQSDIYISEDTAAGAISIDLN